MCCVCMCVCVGGSQILCVSNPNICVTKQPMQNGRTLGQPLLEKIKHVRDKLKKYAIKKVVFQIQSKFYMWLSRVFVNVKEEVTRYLGCFDLSQ